VPVSPVRSNSRLVFPTMVCAHCHRSMCRRNHGAGYVTWFAVPRAQFTLDKGAAEFVRYESSEHGSRSFCGRCGTSLFCDSAKYADRIDVALGTVDGAIDREPQLHTFFDSRAEWVAIGDQLPRLGGKSGLEPLPEEHYAETLTPHPVRIPLGSPQTTPNQFGTSPHLRPPCPLRRVTRVSYLESPRAIALCSRRQSAERSAERASAPSMRRLVSQPRGLHRRIVVAIAIATVVLETFRVGRNRAKS
jgi:hypothetical protein